LIITVDGPAAAGKSTVARELARRLGFAYLDTGAFYRAVTWKALQSGADMCNAQQLAQLAARTNIRLVGEGTGMRVFCDGRDVTEQIRTPQVTENIFRIADPPAVRRALVERQRAFARERDVVAEGRDQGTEVFPTAEVKFYLDASPEERARRRQRQLSESGRELPLREVMQRVAERDRQDRSRPVGALRQSDDMVLIDSTKMTVEQAVEAMLAELERRGIRCPGPGSRQGR